MSSLACNKDLSDKRWLSSSSVTALSQLVLHSSSKRSLSRTCPSMSKDGRWRGMVCSACHVANGRSSRATTTISGMREVVGVLAWY